ncbi:MAG: hypothetical protein H0U39_01510 [Segetibacter sp.]|nr:hypothetical protein [Segetibacter sp.]
MEQVISIKPAQRIGIAASCPFDKSTKEIPYNQYIYFNDLAGLWSKHLNREERILQAGFISIELTARLIETTIDSNREPENKNKIIEFLNDAILKQLDLLLSLNFEKLSNSIHTSNVASDSLNIEGLRFLDDKYAPFIDAFTGKYNLLSKKTGVEIGLGRQVNAIRAHYNLPALKSDFTQQLDYQKLVPSFKIALLKNSKAFNNEDEVFMTIHQISECWLYLAVSELNIIIEQFSKHGLKNNCTKHFSFTSSVLQYVSHHILALEGMVLANYHPLRVALRGASGGQSQQAHKTFGLAIHVYRLFQTIIEAEDISILTILENPVIFKNHNSTISSLTEL